MLKKHLSLQNLTVPTEIQSLASEGASRLQTVGLLSFICKKREENKLQEISVN